MYSPWILSPHIIILWAFLSAEQHIQSICCLCLYHKVFSKLICIFSRNKSVVPITLKLLSCHLKELILFFSKNSACSYQQFKILHGFLKMLHKRNKRLWQRFDHQKISTPIYISLYQGQVRNVHRNQKD